MVNYSMDIFKRAEVEVPHYLLTILLNLSFLTGYIISIFLTSTLKRKVQFLIGVILMSISQAILGLALKAEVSQPSNKNMIILQNKIHCYFLINFLNLQEFQNDTFISMSKILLPLSVITTAFGYSIGLGPVPLALLGEILPLKIKSLATAIIMTMK